MLGFLRLTIDPQLKIFNLIVIRHAKVDGGHGEGDGNLEILRSIIGKYVVNLYLFFTDEERLLVHADIRLVFQRDGSIIITEA